MREGQLGRSCLVTTITVGFRKLLILLEKQFLKEKLRCKNLIYRFELWCEISNCGAKFIVIVATILATNEARNRGCIEDRAQAGPSARPEGKTGRRRDLVDEGQAMTSRAGALISRLPIKGQASTPA
jgi:hypothetical protein